MLKAPHYPQVLESVRRSGQLLPIYLWQGGVIDGSQRQIAALECGFEPHFLTLDTVEKAAPTLFSLHPERAVALFGADLDLLEQVRLFAARPRDVQAARRALDPIIPKPKPVRKCKNWRSGKQTVILPPYLKCKLVDFCALNRTMQQEVIICALEHALESEDAIRYALTRRRVLGIETRRGRKPKKENP